MLKDKKTTNGNLGFTIVELMIATVVFSLVMVMCLTGMVQVSRAYYKGITKSRVQEAGRNLMDEISSTIQFSGSVIIANNGTSLSFGSGPRFASDSYSVINNPMYQTVTDGGFGFFCAGNKKYSYALDKKVVGSGLVGAINGDKSAFHALISEDQQCNPNMLPTKEFTTQVLPTTNNMKSLLSENMRLTRFSVARLDLGANKDNAKSGSELWKIDISIAYGDDDLIQYTDDSGANRVTCRPDTGSEFCAIVEFSKIVTRRIG